MIGPAARALASERFARILARILGAPFRPVRAAGIAERLDDDELARPGTAGPWRDPADPETDLDAPSERAPGAPELAAEDQPEEEAEHAGCSSTSRARTDGDPTQPTRERRGLRGRRGHARANPIAVGVDTIAAYAWRPSRRRSPIRPSRARSAESTRTVARTRPESRRRPIADGERDPRIRPVGYRSRRSPSCTTSPHAVSIGAPLVGLFGTAMSTS